MKQIRFDYNQGSVYDIYKAFQSHPIIGSLYPVNPASFVFFDWNGIFNRAISLYASPIKELNKSK